MNVSYTTQKAEKELVTLVHHRNEIGETVRFYLEPTKPELGSYQVVVKTIIITDDGVEYLVYLDCGDRAEISRDLLDECLGVSEVLPMYHHFQRLVIKEDYLGD